MSNFQKSATKMFKKSHSAANVKNHPFYQSRISEPHVNKKFKIGICAMENKVSLINFHNLNYVIFNE